MTRSALQLIYSPVHADSQSAAPAEPAGRSCFPNEKPPVGEVHPGVLASVHTVSPHLRSTPVSIGLQGGDRNTHRLQRDMYVNKSCVGPLPTRRSESATRRIPTPTEIDIDRLITRQTSKALWWQEPVLRTYPLR